MIVQTWDAAHLESVAMFFVVLAAGLLVRRRDAAAGVALGVAAAFRLTPLVLLVPALLGGRAKPARLLAGFLPAFVVPYVPYLATGGATGSLFEAGTGWTGQAFLFAPLARLTSPEVARVLCARHRHRRRRLDRPTSPRTRAHGRGLRLDPDPARPLPPGGARLVLAHAAGARPGRRHLAARVIGRVAGAHPRGLPVHVAVVAAAVAAGAGRSPALVDTGLERARRQSGVQLSALRRCPILSRTRSSTEGPL